MVFFSLMKKIISLTVASLKGSDMNSVKSPPVRTIEHIDRELRAAVQERDKWIKRVNALSRERCMKVEEINNFSIAA